MQKYYTHSNGKQDGPFSIEELKIIQITRDTMIWFEGADNWRKAIEVEDLKDLFKIIPPPLPTMPPPSLSVQKPEAYAAVTTTPKPKAGNTNVGFFIVAFFIAAGVIGFIYVEQQQKQAEIEQQLEKQNIKIQEQEKLEAKRKEEQIKKEKETKEEESSMEFAALRAQYDAAVAALRVEKSRLNSISSFELLRSSSEKREQIQAQLVRISSAQTEVDRLKSEIGKKLLESKDKMEWKNQRNASKELKDRMKSIKSDMGE